MSFLCAHNLQSDFMLMTTMDKADPQMPITNIELHIWHIDLDQPSDGLPDLLSPDETERADRFTLEQNRNRFVRARGTMRSILGNRLGLSGALLEFGLGKHGKPFISHPESTIEFNLTHCDSMALLAISESSAVGIDLERISSRPSQLKIAKRMFSESVYAELLTLPAERLGSAFTEYWTEFEARSKLHGAGIFSGKGPQDGVVVTHFLPRQGWIACIATGNQGDAFVELKHFNFERP